MKCRLGCAGCGLCNVVVNCDDGSTCRPTEGWYASVVPEGALAGRAFRMGPGRNHDVAARAAALYEAAHPGHPALVVTVLGVQSGTSATFKAEPPVPAAWRVVPVAA